MTAPPIHYRATYANGPYCGADKLRRYKATKTTGPHVHYASMSMDIEKVTCVHCLTKMLEVIHVKRLRRK